MVLSNDAIMELCCLLSRYFVFSFFSAMIDTFLKCICLVTTLTDNKETLLVTKGVKWQRKISDIMNNEIQ